MIGPLGRARAYAVGAVVLFSLAAAGVQSWRLHSEQRSHAATIAQHAELERQRADLAREAYTLAAKATTGVDHAHTAQLEAIRRVAAADARTADSVRVSAAAVSRAAADPAGACGPDERRALAALADLVGEGAGLAAEGRAAAAEVRAQTMSLQNYVRGIEAASKP